MNLLSGEIAHRLTMVFLHSFWQAGLVALILWLLLRCLSARQASMRYAISSSALLFVIVASLATWNLSEPKTTALPQPVRNSSPSNALHSTKPVQTEHISSDSAESDSTVDITRPVTTEAGSPGLVSSDSRIMWTQHLETAVALIWVLGALIMTLRVVRTVFRAGRLVGNDTWQEEIVDLSGLRHLTNELCRQLRLRQTVRVIASSRISVPGVLGTLAPVLLVPTAMVTGLPVDQWRVILAHELAHIRRYDYLVNLLQMMVEAMLFFNPAVWWISRQMRIERETCCDALAVRIAGNEFDVARTLVDVADWYGSSDFALKGGRPEAALQAALDPTNPGSLFDRIRRLAEPDSRPSILLPWYSLMGLALVGGLLFCGLHAGTDVAVRTVQKILTPRERQEQIVNLADQFDKQAEKRAAGVPETQQKLSGKPLSKKVTISGVIRMADGTDLPVGMRILASTHRRLSSNSTTNELAFNMVIKKAVPEYRFTLRVNRGTTHVWCRAPETGESVFDVAVSKPIPVDSPETVDDFEMIIAPGFVGRIRCVDPQGKPVANAILRGNWMAGDKNGKVGLGNAKRLSTDTDGQITLRHAIAGIDFDCTLLAHGYEVESRSVRFKPGEPYEWRLTPAKPTRGIVVSQTTGKPITGAELVFLEETTRVGSHTTRTSGSYDPRENERIPDVRRLARTDANGQFLLDTLKARAGYSVWVQANGYDPVVIKDVHAGRKGLRVELPDPIVIKGYFIGPVEQIKARSWRQPSLQYRNPLPGYNSLLKTPLEIHDDGAHFEIRHLLHNQITFKLPGRNIIRRLDVPIHPEDFVIDLTKPVKEVHRERTQKPRPPTRKVVLRFTGTRDDVPIQGSVRVGYIRRDGPQNRYTGENIEIHDRQVAFEVEVPTKIHYQPERLLGYWFKNQTGTKVPSGDDPFVVDVPVSLAGAIRGTVRNDDGTLSDDFEVRLLVINQKTGQLGSPQTRIPLEKTYGTFLYASVPMRETYRLQIYDNRIHSLAHILTEEFTIDDANPIHEPKLRFPAGATYRLKIVGDDGEPLPDAKVEKRHKGPTHSRENSQAVDENGIARFEHVPEKDIGSWKLNVSDPNHQGVSFPVDWGSLPNPLRLKPGFSASGRIVEHKTGRPIPDASIYLLPKPFKDAKLQDSIFFRTDETGRFEINNLEAMAYEFHLHSAVPPEVPVLSSPDGSYNIDYSKYRNGLPYPLIVGGKSRDVTIRMKLLPDSKLRPVELDETEEN